MCHRRTASDGKRLLNARKRRVFVRVNPYVAFARTSARRARHDFHALPNAFAFPPRTRIIFRPPAYFLGLQVLFDDPTFSETTKDHASRVGITFMLAQELRIQLDPGPPVSPEGNHTSEM